MHIGIWKDNPMVATTRMDLMKCNVSDNQDWNARLFAQVYIYKLCIYLYINFIYPCHLYAVNCEGLEE